MYELETFHKVGLVIIFISLVLVSYSLGTDINGRNYTGKARHVITITPENRTECPTDSDECYTLEELILKGDVDSYMNPLWLEIDFLPGRHIVGENISRTTESYLKVGKILKVDVTGLSSEDTVPIIEHAGLFSFIFEENHYVTISGLNFKQTGVPFIRVYEGEVSGVNYLPQSITISGCRKEVRIEQVSTEGTTIAVHHSISLHVVNSNLHHEAQTVFEYDMDLFNTDKVWLMNSRFGSLKVEGVKKISFRGNVYISNNIGEVISVRRSTLYFERDSVTIISNNTYITGTEDSSIVSLEESSKLLFYRNSTLKVENNTASGCGGIKLDESSLVFITENCSLEFSGNTGKAYGGALAVYHMSAILFTNVFSLDSYTNYQAAVIKFNNNKAGKKGGAIYVDDSQYIKRGVPQIPIVVCKPDVTPILHFINNTADEAGDEIFGGWIDWPFTHEEIVSSPPCNTTSVFSHLNMNSLSTVSSNPTRVCMCNNAIPECNITNYNVSLYPGETLELEAVAVGQRYGTVPSTISAEYVNTNSELSKFERGQNIQSVGRHCTLLRYTVLSLNDKETLYLCPDSAFGIPNLYTGCELCIVNEKKVKSIFIRAPELEKLFSNFSISVKLQECPLGYLLKEQMCKCHHILILNKVTCNTKNYTINRLVTKWINVTFEHTINNTDYGILIHNNCPFDYCKNQDININLKRPQDQCDYDRSLILCGACRNNFSHVFGTSRCKKCSNLWVLLIVPTFILAGIVLVAFLMILDLTVSIGTINGLIFYANILRANQAIFFPTREANTFLNIFIAWMNLDLGMETCFYDGLDAYTKTWLQFLFPLYIWLLVSLIIVSNHYSSRVSRWSGSNAVQVLATLFLLSYVKLLRLIITVFLSTTITYPDGYTRRVWLYDGNVDFLQGKHIPLFIAALLTLIILTLPYTATLTTIQCLQRHKSCKRALFWVHKFKPIFDAHTGPYKSKHRYWTGLLLLVRVALLLVFTINLSGDPSINLLAINITVLCLSMYFQFIGGPYRSKIINLLELSFYFNTIALSTSARFSINTESNSTTVTTVSTSIAFVVLSLIVIYHAIMRITETRNGARLKHSIKERVMACVRQSTPTTLTIILTGQQATTVSRSSIELKEPLLADVVQVKEK